MKVETEAERYIRRMRETHREIDNETEQEERATNTRCGDEIVRAL